MVRFCIVCGELLIEEEEDDICEACLLKDQFYIEEFEELLFEEEDD